MKYKVGIFGSSVNEEQALIKADALAKALSEKSDMVLLITGVADGLPYRIASNAAKKGSEVWGFSAACTLEDQKKLSPQQNYSIYTKLFYVPSSYEHASDVYVSRKYRNVTSTA